MTQDPETTFAAVVTAALCLVGLYYLVRRFLAGPPAPDPWDPVVAAQIESPGSERLCHRCVTPHLPHECFCPNCGAAVGDFNNLLPFEQLFSEGEVFRNGTTQPFRPTGIVVFGYLLASMVAYVIFAPVYWFFLLRNLARRSPVPASTAEPPLPPR